MLGIVPPNWLARTFSTWSSCKLLHELTSGKVPIRLMSFKFISIVRRYCMLPGFAPQVTPLKRHQLGVTDRSAYTGGVVIVHDVLPYGSSLPAVILHTIGLDSIHLNGVENLHVILK